MVHVSVNPHRITLKFLLFVETSTVGVHGQMRVFLKTYGCSANTADGEALAGCLTNAGHQLAASEQEADVLIYNTCAVKGPTENRIIDDMKHAPKGKKLIVAGCLP